MFSEEEIKELKKDGLTDEEIEVLSDAFALKETVDLLPDNIEEFIQEYESKIPDDAVQGMRATFELAQTNPKLFQQIMALDIVLSSELEEESVQAVEKTFVTELPQEEYETASKNFFNTLVNLSEEDRKEFLKLIAEITPEQKRDMVSRLIKK